MRSYLLLSIITTLFMLSCKGQKGSVITFPTAVKVAEVKSLEYINNSFPAVVKSQESSNLAFKMGGLLLRIFVEEGESVKRGALIAELDSSDFILQQEAAKAAYIKTRSQLDRFKRLIERDAISKQEYEGVMAMYVKDKAAYENAQLAVEEAKIYAPFDGVIERRYVDSYQRVQPAEPIVSLVNLDSLEMSFTISESLVSLMAVPDKMFFVRFETYPNHFFKAKLLKFVDSSVSGGYPVTVAIDDKRFNTSLYRIKPGFSCTVYVEIRNKEYKGVVIVPATAVAEDMSNNRQYVWIYNRDSGDVERRYVDVRGLYGVSDLALTSGVSAGDEVVTAGVYSLQEGQKVVVK